MTERRGVVRDQAAQCGTKRRWGSRSVAKAQAKSLAKVQGQKMDVYECSHCSFWHVGHALRSDP